MFGGMIGAALWLFNPPKLPEENMKKHLMKKVIIDGVEYVPVTPEVKEEKRREFFVNCVDSIEEFGLGRLRINAWSTPVRDNSNPHEMRFIHIKENEIIVSGDEAYMALSVFMCDPFIKKNNDYETYLETLGFKKDGV